MDKRIEEKEKALLLLIDRYNEESEKDRLYFLKYKKNNPDSGLNKEPFLTFYKLFESKASQIEISELLYHFGSIRLLKTFHYSHYAESLIESFEKLSLPIPHFVLECQNEVIQREEIIEAYFENENFKWSQSEKEKFLFDIQKEARNHSFNQKGEKEYLTKKFEEAIQETRVIEKEINQRFGYIVEGFFDGETFTLSKGDLNEYFYHSEIASGGVGSWFEVLKALNKYGSKKNELFALRGFLSGQNDSIGLESIWMAKPKHEIEFVLKKGFDLGVWDEKNRLQTKRGANYGHGKRFLSNLYHTLKGDSIKNEIHDEKVGKILCDFFKIEIGNAKEPFKTFQSGSPKQIELIKKHFKLN